MWVNTNFFKLTQMFTKDLFSNPGSRFPGTGLRDPGDAVPDADPKHSPENL